MSYFDLPYQVILLLEYCESFRIFFVISNFCFVVNTCSEQLCSYFSAEDPFRIQIGQISNHDCCVENFVPPGDCVTLPGPNCAVQASGGKDEKGTKGSDLIRGMAEELDRMGQHHPELLLCPCPFP